VNGTGSVSFEEFIAEYMRMKQFHAMRQLQQNIQDGDKDGDGEISKAELFAVLKQLMGEQTAKVRTTRRASPCFMHNTLTHTIHKHKHKHKLKHTRNQPRIKSTRSFLPWMWTAAAASACRN
jgi:hypothetical protein